MSARQTEREREGKGSKGGGGRKTSQVCTIFIQTDRGCVCPGLHFPSLLSLSLFLSLSSLSFSLSCFSLSFSVSIQTVCSFQQQDEEDTGERLGRGKKGETVINTRQSGTERKQDVQRVKEGDRGDLAFQSDQKRRSCKKNNRGMQREKEALLLKGI